MKTLDQFKKGRLTLPADHVVDIRVIEYMAGKQRGMPSSHHRDHVRVKALRYRCYVCSLPGNRRQTMTISRQDPALSLLIASLISSPFMP